MKYTLERLAVSAVSAALAAEDASEERIVHTINFEDHIDYDSMFLKWVEKQDGETKEQLLEKFHAYWSSGTDAEERIKSLTHDDFISWVARYFKRRFYEATYNSSPTDIFRDYAISIVGKYGTN